MCFCLTPGQTHDLVGSDVLLPVVAGDIEALLADKAYDAQQRVLDYLAQHDVQAVIPSKRHRKQARRYDETMYQWRHLVESFFQKLKQYRAIATRYDKRAASFLGGIHLAAIAIWLN